MADADWKCFARLAASDWIQSASRCLEGSGGFETRNRAEGAGLGGSELLEYWAFASRKESKHAVEARCGHR